MYDKDLQHLVSVQPNRMIHSLNEVFGVTYAIDYVFLKYV